ncbi:MAG: DUF202 domain-containing protein [Bacillota bacterium]
MNNTETQENLARIRTILAIERTFAAWIRTGLAGIGGGLAMVKLVTFKTETHQVFSRVIGILLIIWGITIIISGLINYKNSLKTLNQDNIYKISFAKFSFLSLILIAAAILILIVLIPVV